MDTQQYDISFADAPNIYYGSYDIVVTQPAGISSQYHTGSPTGYGYMLTSSNYGPVTLKPGDTLIFTFLPYLNLNENEIVNTVKVSDVLSIFK